ncbi:hypothetical protein ACN258_003202 [Vibrio cholerae]|nr:hypothetical protein [Vibrio cholerae]EGR0604374.1 hypothetical protein [Vibrio cholerae]EGR3932857.1 hypothetical protein [Vibrio cholerae]HDL8937555.1 hypothetical protein [Vibrio cholerae]
MFLSFIWFFIFKNSSYFSFICLVGCFQFFDFFVVVFIGFLFLFYAFILVIFSFFYFILIGFRLFGVGLLSWFGWWQVFLFCNFIE